MKTKKKRFLGVLLTLALMLGLMQVTGLTVYAGVNDDYDSVDVTDSLYSASSVSQLQNELTGFVSCDFYTAKTWIPPITTGYVRLIREISDPYIRVTIFKDGQYVNDSGIKLSMAQSATAKYFILKAVNVTGIKLNKTSTSILVGSTETLTATITPDNATNKSVTWASSNTAVATVDNGVVTAIAPGSATITVTTKDGNKTDSCSVTVSKADQTVTAPAAVSGLVYDNSAKTLVTAATVTEGNTASGSISYSLDNAGWSTSLPQGTDAGNYTVYYKVAGNNNYNEFVCSSPVSVSIAKADPEAPTGLTAIVGQTLDNITLPEGWEWDAPATALTESGDKTFPAHFTKTTNYNSKNADLTVTVADVSFYDFDGDSQIYNKSDLIFTFMMDGDDANTYQYMETFKKATIKGPDIDRALNSDEYTAENGSLKLTLLNSFLETLKPGTYTVTVYFVDETEAHSASAKFTVPSSGGTDISETGENIMLIGAAMILVILSLSAIAYIMLRQRRYLTAKN